MLITPMGPFEDAKTAAHGQTIGWVDANECFFD
jgi:hypothetical protein